MDRDEPDLSPAAWFVDESKSHGYHLVAVEARHRELADLRRRLRDLRRPGQRRLHFTRESESSRRLLAGALVQLPVRGRVWTIRGVDDKTARTRCLEQLVDDATNAGVLRVVLERDASIEAADRRIIRDRLGRTGAALRYEHADAHNEPLLWVADAIAWSRQAGGRWTKRFEPIVAHVERLRITGRG